MTDVSSSDQSEVDFTCACCYDLLLDPVTLLCGHSFCAACVAAWFLESRRTECPACRQKWIGHPQVNRTLRAALQKLYPGRLEERQHAALGDPEHSGKVARFHEEMEQAARNIHGIRGARQHAQFPGRGRSFLQGAATALLSVLLYIGVSYFLDARSDISQKPVIKWSVNEVQQWLADLGPWTQPELSDRFADGHVDGPLLQALQDDDIESLLGNCSLSALHHRALRLAIHSLQTAGIKPPTSIHEYKALHRGKAVVLLYGLRNYPRSSLLLMALSDYTDTFLPFLHATCPVLEGVEAWSLYGMKLPPPTLAQWLDFLLKWLLVPYWLIGTFCMRSSSSFLQMAVLTGCAAHTGMEAIGVQLAYKQSFRNVGDVIVNHVKLNLGMLLLFVLWPLIPSLVIDCGFNFGVYYLPFFDIYTLFKLLVHT